MSDEEIEQLRKELRDVRHTAEFAVEIAKDAENVVQDLSDRVDQLEAENDELRQRLEKHEDSDAFLQNAQKKGASTGVQRSAIILQTLAMRARGRGSSRSEMTADGCETALNAVGESVDRTSTYDILRRAARLIDDDDTVWFQKEPRSAQKPSRLIMDLSDGYLPAMVKGFDLSEGAVPGD